jgi:hypothetical protein
MSEVGNAFKKIYKDQDILSSEGIEQVIGYNEKDEEMVLIVAQAGNPVHQKTQRKYARALEKARTSKKKQDKIYARIIGESILLGWRGILDTKGKPVDDKLENRIEALANKELMNEVLDIAMERTNFIGDGKDETPEEATEGNS